LKAAVIGIGPQGRRIVNVLGDLPGVELAAVVDRSQKALAAVKLPADTARYTSDEQLWSRGDVSLVCVATNGPSHAEVAEKAMDAGVRYLLVEKPMACSLAECDRILAKARTTATRVAVDHSRRYMPVYRWLRKRIASGDWGKLRSIWIQRPDIGLGCNATHSFDLVAFLADQPVRRVTGWIDTAIRKNPRGDQFEDPGGLVVMELEQNIRAVVAQIEDGAGPTSVEIALTAARIRLCEKFGSIEVKEAQLPPGGGRPSEFHDGQLPDGLTAKPDMPAMIRGCLTDLTSDHFIAADALHGRLAVEVLVAAYLSHERGHCPVELPLKLPKELERWLPVT
jgi:myo-inositol 2-dehydrogenase / D-chiro-inositol 1-dehydrogenase